MENHKLLTPALTLDNGDKLPLVGLGTWLMTEEVEDKISLALSLGYTHIDTAIDYGNEKRIEEGIKKSGYSREGLFITSKIPAHVKTYEGAKEAIRSSVSIFSYLDLMLIHSPMPWDEFRVEGGYRYEKENLEVYRALVEAKEEGMVRHIGVSNFNESDMENIAQKYGYPEVNQIPFYIGDSNLELLRYCQAHGVVVEAYSPLGHGKIFSNEKVLNMAARYGVTSAKLAIAFTLQLGTVSLPKASSAEWLKANLDVFDLRIDEKDMEALLSN